MQAVFVREAEKYDVFPLDNQQFQRAIAPRPSQTAGRTVFPFNRLKRPVGELDRLSVFIFLFV